MADETQNNGKAEETKLEPVGTDPTVTEQADLGAAIGPGEDYDQPPEDEMSEEEKAAAEEAQREVRSDPTRGMKDNERADYWMKKAHHFEGEYKSERGKRQAYDKRYGGLNSAANGLAKTPQLSTPYRGGPDDEIPADNLRSYTNWIMDQAKDQFRKQMTEEKLNDRVESSEVRARDAHNGQDGWPAYDEIFDEQVNPMLQKNPRIVELLRLMPDPAEATYTLGVLLKYPNLQEMIKSHANEDLIKKINGTAKQAATVQGKKGGKQPSGRLTKEEIDNMSPEDFERELERFRSQA